MAQAVSTPVEDSVSKINDEVAVGEDLEFQERWWRFERIVWAFFTLLIVLDLAGAFGRGPLAKAERRTSDGTLDVHYERIERTGTPAIMRIHFGPDAIHNGEVKLFVSNSLVNELGNQRVIPAPVSTSIGDGGLTYTFPTTALPAEVSFALQPAGPGIFPIKLQVPGADSIETKIVVVP